MGFKDSVNNKKESKPEWKVLENLGTIQKNRTDTIKVTRVQFKDMELINLQVWKEDKNTGKEFPVKEQKMSFNVELRDQVADAIKGELL